MTNILKIMKIRIKMLKLRQLWEYAINNQKNLFFIKKRSKKKSFYKVYKKPLNLLKN